MSFEGLADGVYKTLHALAQSRTALEQAATLVREAHLYLAAELDSSNAPESAPIIAATRQAEAEIAQLYNLLIQADLSLSTYLPNLGGERLRPPAYGRVDEPRISTTTRVRAHDGSTYPAAAAW